MNLPNILTMSRIAAAAVIASLLLNNNSNGAALATVIFIAASVTDFYDGYLAKTSGQVSDFGKIMDPIADKVLVLTVFGALAYLGLLAWWMVMVIAAREVAVTVSRLKAMAQGRVLAAETMGKIKTVFQMASVSLALLFLTVEQSAFAQTWFYKVDLPWRGVINLFMLVSVVLTLVSGIAYFRKCRCA